MAWQRWGEAGGGELIDWGTTARMQEQHKPAQQNSEREKTADEAMTDEKDDDSLSDVHACGGVSEDLAHYWEETSNRTGTVL